MESHDQWAVQTVGIVHVVYFHLTDYSNAEFTLKDCSPDFALSEVL